MERFNQQESIGKIKRNIEQAFQNFFPHERGSYRFTVDNLRMEDPEMGYKAQEQAFHNDENIEMKVYADIKIFHKNKNGEFKLLKKHDNSLITSVPLPTERGTYIRNGTESVVLNRMQMRNGVYVHPKKIVDRSSIIPTEVRAGRRRFRIIYNADKGQFTLKDLSMDFNHQGSSNLDLIAFLQFMGVANTEITQAIGDPELAQNILEKARETSPEQVYKQLFGNMPFPGMDEARQNINDYMQKRLTFDDEAKKVNSQTIGETKDAFDPSTMLTIIQKTLQEDKDPGSNESPDDFRFKEVKGPEDSIAESVEKGLNLWVKKMNKTSLIHPNSPDSIRKINARPVDTVSKQVNELYSSSLAENVNSANPLNNHQLLYKITSLGEGGLSTQTAADANRNLQDTAFAKIDPVDTPQSGRMGLTQHLASGAKIKDKKVYSKFYRVNNRKIDKSRVVDDLDPLDEYDEHIAFWNPDVMNKSKDGKYIGFKDVQVRVRHKGDFTTVPANRVTLVDQGPASHFGHAASLIPYSDHNDGARMLMGAGMQRQTLNLRDPDAPIVQSITDTDTGKTAEEEVADNASFALKSPYEGTIRKIKDDTIEIENDKGEIEKVDKLNYFTTGSGGSFINHKPTVKEGDKVKKGQLLADGWQSKDGKLALGKNVQVAYMPYDGYNFEDGVVASESFVNKMSSEEIELVKVEIDKGDSVAYYGDPEVIEKMRELNVSPGLLRNLDRNGIIKKGTDVKAGDILVAHVRERESREQSDGEKDTQKLLHGRVLNLPEDQYMDRSYRLKGYQSGKVIDVFKTTSGTGGMKVTIKLLTYSTMNVGDKVSGRHGNKGVISKILPDHEMPRTEDGDQTELLFSPLAIPSRKNMGQLFEINAGLVAQKKGLKDYKVENFNHGEVDRLKKELKEIGLPDGKQTMINPKTGKPFENKVTTGPQYILKLEHKVDKKITSRNIKGALDEVNQMPRKTSGAVDGDRHNPQSVGGMEFWSLTSAGAVENIHEMTTLKTDGAGDRKQRNEIFNAIRNGSTIPDPVTPGTLKTLGDKFAGAGLKMQPLKDGKEATMDDKFTELMLEPMNDKQIKALAPKTVTSDQSFKASTKDYVEGGIYDEKIFGVNGDQWGRIDLAEPIPHPILMENTSGNNPFEAMLTSKGIKVSDMKRIMNGDKFVVIDTDVDTLKPGDIVTEAEIIAAEEENLDIVVESGGAAIAKLLEDVNIEEEYKKAETRLNEATKAADRSREAKIVKILGKALDKNMKPEDFMMNSLPVLPMKHRRPLLLGEGKDLSESDISKMYTDIVKQNNKMKAVKGKGGLSPYTTSPELMNKVKGEHYKTVQQMMGVATDKERRTAQDGTKMKGILDDLSSKEGFLRNRMQSKMQDYSGRGVITVDPTLKTDEAMLPEDMAAEMFDPMIKKKMKDKHFSPDEIKNSISKRDKDFRRALDEVAAERPVLLNRQPSLHRHSIQAFNAKIRYNGDEGDRAQRSIGINPVITTGFNADFDGDQMAVHVPITDAAVKEAKEKMMPSQNVLNPTDNGLILDLKHEMQLGIFYMTRDRKPEGDPIQYGDFDRLYDAYKNGQVQTYQAVRMNVPRLGSVTSTAGRHIFNLSLPEGMQNYEENVDMNKAKTQRLLMDIVNSPQFGGVKAAVDTIDRLQGVSFTASTNSGMSIGITDFDDIDANTTQEIQQVAEKALKDKGMKSPVSGLIDARTVFDEKLTNDTKAGLGDWIKKNVNKDSSLGAMVASGARGNASQLNAMAGIIGVGKDVENKGTRPILSSHLKGLSPDEFWDLSYDSRKGILDKSIESQRPGALTREIWMSNKQSVISQKDCKDRTGMKINFSDGNETTNKRNRKKIHGRVLLSPVELKNGGSVQVTGQPITNQELDSILKNGQGIIHFRSPLTCKATSGVCQKCYGKGPGSTNNNLVDLGTPIGSIAAQALGEPSQQAVMNAFHVGAAESKSSGAFDMIEQTLRAGKTATDPTIEAVIAEKSGVVKEINTDPFEGTSIKVEGRRSPYKLGRKAKADHIEVGVTIEKGELLTKEFDENGNQLVIRNPHHVLEYQGLGAAQDLITNNLEQAYQQGGTDNIDSRHFELVTRNMSDNALVTDPGTSPFRPGQEVRKGVIDQYNRTAGKTHSVSMDYSNRSNVIGSVAAQDYREGITMLSPIVVRKGEVITGEIWDALKDKRTIQVKKKPVQFDTSIRGVNWSKPNDDNWLDAAAYQHGKKNIKSGAVFGMKDKLDNPLTRQMTGLKGNFASGFTDFKLKLEKMKDNSFLSGFL